MTTSPRLEVADVIRAHGDAFLKASGAALTPEQRRVLTDLPRCRTAALGGHVEGCDRCGHQRIAYNSCRNRHCPKCQATAAARWLEARAAELLPVPYFHVVFTLPTALNRLALHNPRLVYDLLLRAAAATLLRIAADPKHLGAEIGVLAVLHTWGQGLQLHPHVHCVVTGGGLAGDGARWVAGRARFFLPVRVLSRVFRGKFLRGLDAALRGGRLTPPDPGLGAEGVRRLLRQAARPRWVVYAKPPFGGPGRVLKYLARYTHRVAISNHRLIGMGDGRVRFRWKDYAHGSRPREMSLDGPEFLRRLLLHVLPSGFVRIRHYGLLAHRHRREKLVRCRTLLGPPGTDAPQTVPGPRGIAPGLTRVRDAALCPVCGAARMVRRAELPRVVAPSGRDRRAAAGGNIDSS